jgi:hypothetical protein
VDRRSIKDILLRRRPWMAASREDQQAELDRTPLDIELTEFKSRHEEFNARVHHELAGIPVPPTLREQIFARRKVVRVRGWRSRGPIVLAALAASIALLAAVTLLTRTVPKEDTSFAGFRQRIITDALRAYGMDTNTTKLVEVKSLLARSGRPADFSLPAPLEKLPVIGGGSLSWQNKPVSMVCFKSPQQDIFYMFVIDQTAFGFSGRKPEVEQVKGLSTVSWSSGGKVFLLAAKVPPGVVKQLAVDEGV